MKWVSAQPMRGKKNASRSAHRHVMTRSIPAKRTIASSPDSLELNPSTQIPLDNCFALPAHQFPMMHTSAGSVAEPTKLMHAISKAKRPKLEAKDNANRNIERAMKV
mmetsp:Transcript_15630/g.24996  ORF Transcript_15630/g.24996 Transcript_15630/m.24996 type:complete len:107 (-) Transcript_15630:494-814(-)